ncbi:hypothetical protein SPRG_00324 [Saprolegnia parasitica CBS 223.65]|uniref:Dual specificity phosphatase n=1 Tax=Saprolegnia parasitica (strain CBS 223.65) TaxID=695850 RepID=A0A067D8Z1_SAPPC|nr:hypothetical protein SPRG_00324 [Saprolegnia parasitica CBS 223.65]KDO35477.1 hypothetical protein SPRG_00324 [Saprolegnia parasitica CBS 223.65]|eukprot:XP_012193814.1 hypothetical protein SPRG_00324 [Saprolegnia parasitica CBS 223.65]
MEMKRKHTPADEGPLPIETNACGAKGKTRKRDAENAHANAGDGNDENGENDDEDHEAACGDDAPLAVAKQPLAKPRPRMRNPGNLLLDLSTMEPHPPPTHGGKKVDYANVCSRVTDFLYVGGAVVAAKHETLLGHGITHIINCAGTVTPDFFPHLFSYYHLRLRDHATQDIHRHFYNIFHFIDAAREANGKVFVHCVKGISRSPTMAIAYLMAREQLGLYPALERVRASRPVIDPNAGFIFQLNEWDSLRQQARKQVTIFRIESSFSDDDDVDDESHPLIVGPMTPQQLVSISPEVATVLDEHHESCFVVLSMDTNYCSLWCGRDVSDSLVASGRAAMRLLQTYEAFPPTFEVVLSGHEPATFWSVVAPEAEVRVRDHNDDDDGAATRDDRPSSSSSCLTHA